MDGITFKNLKPGDVVRSGLNGVRYIVHANYGDRVTVVKTVDITESSEWELAYSPQLENPEKSPDILDSKNKWLVIRVTLDSETVVLADSGNFIPLNDWPQFDKGVPRVFLDEEMAAFNLPEHAEWFEITERFIARLRLSRHHSAMFDKSS
jgi:hypothetical protein